MKVENDMDYKIIADSCCDLTDEMKDWGNLALVPLTLELGDYRIMDDENFDQDDFIARMQALGDVPRSACPSPDAFCAAIAADDAKEVYVLTITDKLSGCYNSALQGVMLYEDDHPGEKKIHVFNSLATSGLETLIAYEIRRLKDSGLPFEQVVEQVEDYIHNHTALYFCLESLDALKNNGRLFSLAATVIKKLKMKLICQHLPEKLLWKQSHVCCPEKANTIADKVREKCSFGNIIILKASGLNSLYASGGGVIVSYDK